MCLILFGIDITPDIPFILAANRDEFYARPTRAMAFWPESPDILAGRDLQAGGTWFGVSRPGRFAALTNYRDLTRIKADAPSRGEIIPDALGFPGSVPAYLSRLDSWASQYSGFNLLAGEAGGEVYWYSNITREIKRVPPGFHGLSNAFLDTPWPKVALGRQLLEEAVRNTFPDEDALFALLSDTGRPPDGDLPDTGVGLEWERILSPLFIRSDTYGTRSSTLMHAGAPGEIRVTERTWEDGSHRETRDRSFTLHPASRRNKPD